MSLTETTAKAGSTSATNNGNRWGDYSQTTIDPADGGLTFWHTNQYMATGGNLKSRIFSFQVPSCTSTGIGAIENKNEIILTAFQSDQLLTIRATNIQQQNNIDVSLYNVEGKLLTNKMVFPLSGMVETSLNIEGLAKGVYYVRLGNNYFQRVTKVSVQ